MPEKFFGLKEKPFKKPLFSAGAMQEICLRSGGVPRLINILCDSSLLNGYVNQRRLINKKAVREAADDYHLGQNNFPEPRIAPS